MKPLRESIDSDDRLVATAAALLRAARPVENPGARARVRLALERGTVAAGAPSPLIFALALAGFVALAVTAGLLLRSSSKVQVDVTPPTRPRERKAPNLEPPSPAVSLPAAAPLRFAPPKHSRSAKAPPARAVEDPRESALVVEAMTRLRRNRDAAGAAKLLEQYLRRFPDGVLAEEALALAVEAASSKGDLAHAATLRALYRERHPEGRFRDAVERAP